MSRMTDAEIEDFKNAVYEIVSQIPEGKVLSYGTIATLAGYPGYHRLVGRTLHGVPQTLKLPCHRVVNSQGRLVPDWTEQKNLLLAEGVTFRINNNVDMSLHNWILHINC